MSGENKNKVLDNFYPVFCPDCQAKGCPRCREQGLVFWYSDFAADRPQERLLYWGKVVDWSHIAQYEMEKLVRKIINGILVAFGIIGLLLAAWVYIPFIAEGKAFDISFWPLVIHFKTWPVLHHDWRLILFWLSVITDLYIYYRLDRESEKQELVIKKTFQERALVADDFVPVIPSWQELQVDNKSESIDISLAFDQQAVEVIFRAWRLAKNWHQPAVAPIHLLASLFSFQKVAIIFSRLGVDWDKLINQTKQAMAKIPRGDGDPYLSAEIKQLFFKAYEQAYEMRQSKVTVAELLIACDLESQSLTAGLLYNLEIDVNKIKNVVVWFQINEALRIQWKYYHGRGGLRPKGEMNKAMTAVMTPYLDNFATDLTRLAAYGHFSPVVGRDKEFDEIFRIIEGTKGSVVLVGLPGVGKTTMIEGLAQRMIADDVPKILQDKRLVSLSISKLTAGADASAANERLLQIFYEINKAGNIIMVIEDIHSLIGISAGSGESLDLSEVLANYLSNSQTLVFATTTPQDYQYIESQTTLAGALHKVPIEEPGSNQAIQILESKIGSIEYQNKVIFSYDAIAKTVELAMRLMHDRQLPAKAIDLLKEVAVYTGKSRGQNASVTAEDVAVIVSQKTKVPVTKITQTESDKLLNLEQQIHDRMVDQEQAVVEVAAALRRSRAELREIKRPIANFLFLGPTGVGKTELAKTVAEVYFGNEENMIRLDMSEYQTKDSLYRLVGMPGAETSGFLTEAIRQTPFTLLLCDEVEKAHPDILNVFLQVMDDGRLTDNLGRTVDFTNAIIIMTSNAGTSYIHEQIKAGVDINKIKEDLIESQLGTYFRPEFLNRFDAINVFKPLTMVEVRQIAKLMLKKVAKSLEVKGIGLEFTDAAIEELAVAGFDPQFGARPLRRVIQDKVSNILANLTISGKIQRKDRIILDAGGEIRIEQGVYTK
ncbi:MAG: ATP-dependent Clp protease ATP-binding subunit [Patescibacteria group bacterium]